MYCIEKKETIRLFYSPGHFAVLAYRSRHLSSAEDHHGREDRLCPTLSDRLPLRIQQIRRSISSKSRGAKIVLPGSVSHHVLCAGTGSNRFRTGLHTADLCLPVFPRAHFRKTKATIEAHTLLDLQGSIHHRRSMASRLS